MIRIGINAATLTIANAKAEEATVGTTQPSANCCIQAPWFAKWQVG
jgi:hypothetical protein